MERIKFNVACGPDIRPGFVNIDIAPAPGVDVVCDLLKTPWVFGEEEVPENSVDDVICSHFIEHIPVERFIPFMNECHRVLVPGGHMLIITPDCSEASFWTDPTHVRGYKIETFSLFFSERLANHPAMPRYGIVGWSDCIWSVTPEPMTLNGLPSRLFTILLRK